jgi:anaerobic magnesium-protoporphyrin IX monomethyl ester cyclase
LGRRIILYVGTIEPRKNLPLLIDAFARARRQGALDHQLVCVGPYGWRSGGIERLIETSNVRDAITFTGYVPFEDLPALYSAAEMLVYPSMYEGFGLPVVEAMACGTPVVTGRAAAVAEVGADAVEHLDWTSADRLADVLTRLARNPERRHQLSSVGRSRAEQFSWGRAAAESFAVYREVAGAPARQEAAARVGEAGVSIETAPAVDVLFGQAYFLRFDPKLWQAQQPYAPLGALYAASCARSGGYRVAMFDAMLAESEQDWADALDRQRPRIAVIYEDNFNYLSKMCLLRMRQAALTMIAAARARGLRVIVSGSDASDHPATYLDGGADVVIVGEGERTLVELLDVMSGRRQGRFAGVDGVSYRDDQGRVVRSKPRAIVRDLDALPRPAWDLVDVDAYRSVWMSRHGYFSMNLVTTRGCPYHCNWCAKPIYGQRYTARSPESVADEVGWLKHAYRPDHLWIADDIFGLKPGWIERFASIVEKEQTSVPFKCLLRADQVTPTVVDALRRAGCRTAWIGAESGSQRVLDAMEKGITVDQIWRATTLLRAHDIQVGFFLQFGYPGETKEDIDKTLAMIKRCRPDDIGVSVSYPLPGTTFYQRVQAQLGKKQNWVDSNDLAMMYRATYVPDFYRALHAIVHAEFRDRRAVDELKTLLADPAKARPRHVRVALQIMDGRFRLPILRRRVARLGQVPQSHPAVVPVAVLSPQAAAIPTEQPR